jgi:hypothetical protein
MVPVSAGLVNLWKVSVGVHAWISRSSHTTSNMSYSLLVVFHIELRQKAIHETGAGLINSMPVETSRLVPKAVELGRQYPHESQDTAILH